MSTDDKVDVSNKSTPLAVKSVIDNSRSFAVFFATIYAVLAVYALYFIATNNGSDSAVALLVFYIIMSVLYILCVVNLSKRSTVSIAGATGAAVLTLLSVFSIVGIFIDIALWRNVGSLNKYKRQGRKAFETDEEWKANHNNSWSNKRQIVTSIIAGVLIGAVICTLNVAGNSSTSSTTDSSTNASVVTTPFTSTQHGFSITFPSTPTEENSTQTVQGVSVPGSTYSSETNYGNTAYFVYVSDYPSQFDMSDINARLEGALNGLVNSGSGTLISSAYGTTAGYTSLSGHATIYQNDQSYDVYSTVFLKANILFQIMTIGASENEFNQFAHTFTLT